jgi:hypothetical protein
MVYFWSFFGNHIFSSNQFFLEEIKEEELIFRVYFFSLLQVGKRMNLSVPKVEIREFLKEKEL